MKGRGAALAAGIAVTVALVAPAGAGAATVTIGSPITGGFDNNPAGGTATNAMVSGPNLASPVDGTVINWHTQGFAGTLRLRVLKLDPAFAATAVANSAPIELAGGTVDTPLNVPIHKGEVVGFENTSPADRADVRSSGIYTSAFWASLPDNGSPQPSNDDSPLEFAYNATVRYCVVPSLVGQNLGAAGQALTDAGCALGTVSQKKFKKKKGKKKPKGPKIVTSQSVPPGTSLGDQARVDVQVKVKPKKKRKKK